MALSLRAASGANLSSATPTSQAITLPTGTAYNDLVYFVISVGAVISAPTLTTGSGWTLRLTTNATAATSTIVGYKTIGVAETAPTVSWTTAGRVAWNAIGLAPAAGFAATHSGFATVSNTGTAATTHTPNSFAAGAATGTSVLLTGLRVSATGATGVTNTAPTNWTEPTNGDQTTAITSSARQQGSTVDYRLAQTGTIAPGVITHSLSSFAIIEHAFAIEFSPATGTGYLANAQAVRTTSVASSTWTLAPAINTAATELLVAKCSSGSQNVTATGISSSPALTWTKRADTGVVASNAAASIWTAPAPAAGGVVTATVTFTNAGTSTVIPTEVALERWGGVNPSNTVDTSTGNTTGADSVLVTSDTSYVTWVIADWNGITGAVTYVASNTETAPPYQQSTAVSTYKAQRSTPQAGWPYYDYGITAPISGSKFAIAALELDTNVKADTVLAQASAGVLMTPLIGRLGYAPIGTSAIGTDPLGGGNAGPVTNLTDDFAVQDTTKWTWLGTAGVTSGQLVEACASNYGNIITSVLPYDLTGTGVLVQAATRPAVGSGTTEMFLQVQTEPLSNAYALSLDISGSNLVAKTIVDQAQTTVLSAAYSATNHAWLKIREASGTIYFDTSPDGSTWTNFTSTAAPFRPDGLYVQLGTGYYGTESAPGNAVWDNLNVPPSGPATLSGAVALTGTGTLAAAGTIVKLGATSLTGTGTLSAAVTQTGFGTTSLAGAGGLTATATQTTFGTTTLAGAGALTATAVQTGFGATSLAGAGSLTATATQTGFGAASLGGVGAVTATATAIYQVSATLAGAGGLTATATQTTFGATSLAGSGALTADGSASRAGAASLSGAGGLTATADRTAVSAATLSGAGAVSATATATYQVSATLAGAGGLTATATQTGFGAATLAGSGGLSATATQTEFTTAILAGAGGLSATSTQTEFATASLAGAGGLSATATQTTFGTTTLAGVGGLTADTNGNASGTATLTGAGGLTATADVTAVAAVALTGTGTLSADGLVTELGAVALAGTGSLTATAGLETFGAVALSGAGALSADGTSSGSTTATLAGAGGLTATADVTDLATATLAGAGGLTATATLDGHATATLGGTGGLTATATPTEFGAATLAGSGAVTADATVIPTGGTSLAGVGALSATATVMQFATVTLGGSGAVSAAGVLNRPGAALLAGVGSLLDDGRGTSFAAVTLGASGAVSATGTYVHEAAVVLGATGAVTATGGVTAVAAVVLGGIGGVSAAPQWTAFVAISLSGAGSLAATATLTQAVAISLAASGGMVATGVDESGVDLRGLGAVTATAVTSGFGFTVLIASAAIAPAPGALVGEVPAEQPGALVSTGPSVPASILH